MITRVLSAVIKDPQGDLLASGTLEVTPATRSRVVSDADAIVAGTQIYTIATGALTGSPTIQAPGQYLFEIKDAAGGLIVAFRGTVADDVATAISLQEIAQTNISQPNDLLPRKYTDATRPAAGVESRTIYNTDDGKLNIDNGTAWTLPDGTVT